MKIYCGPFPVRKMWVKHVFVAGDTATAKRFFEKFAKPVLLAGFELGPTTPFAASNVNVLLKGPERFRLSVCHIVFRS